MAILGYARVSSTGQSYETQVERLKAAGCTKLFVEKVSGTSRERPELKRMLDYAREDDQVYVTKLDRLARSTIDLYAIIEQMRAKDVGFKVLDDEAVDTTTRTGKFLLGILALVAEFETEIRKERQLEGIARAKAQGRSGGRPKTITDDLVQRMRTLRDGGSTVRQIAAETGMSKTAVARALTSA